jgi:hypothetical protein
MSSIAITTTINTAPVTMPYPIVRPASPTLTNPDMILPYGEYDDDISSEHKSEPWKTSRPSSIKLPIGANAHADYGQISPVTPIMYGNGTTLSDIVEVSEFEGTPVKGRTPRLDGTGFDLPFRSSPTVGYEAVSKRAKKGTHQRTVSTESTSTITTVEAAEMAYATDEAASHADSSFQGDDKQSLADTYSVITSSTRGAYGMKGDAILGNEEALTSAALSKRAEMILANAKKRLHVSV